MSMLGVWSSFCSGCRDGQPIANSLRTGGGFACIPLIPNLSRLQNPMPPRLLRQQGAPHLQSHRRRMIPETETRDPSHPLA